MKLGLFLTPGAARTAYQVGAVQALLNEGGLRFDVISASSVGTLNGAFAATGQIDQLVQLWSNWCTSDIMGVDWAALLKGAVLWAPNLMHNRPQKSYIDQYIDEKKLVPGLRFRCNLAGLTSGNQEILEWPGTSIPLPAGVNASVAVPAAIKPFEAFNQQWVDGLTIDGFPLEEMVLETGVERVFVVGVAPRTYEGKPCTNAYQIALRAAEWNQYNETLAGLQQVEETNALIQSWVADREAVEQAVSALITDSDIRAELLAEIERAYLEAAFPYTRPVVEIIPILPEQEIAMFFTDYQPERSRTLIELGRQDALQVLHTLDAYK
jgi:predicted acylesterase/phospholipase RssA